jgi:hypothetical protein
MASATRVTRLGEFSTIGRLFALGSCLKMTEVAQILGLLVSSQQVTESFFSKNRLGHILGAFFINSSGHPDRN